MLEGITRADNAVSSVYMLHEAPAVECQTCWLSRQNQMDKVASQQQDFYGRVHNIYYQGKYG